MLDCDGSRPSDKARMAKLVYQGLSNPPACLAECAKAAITRMLPKGLPYCGETTVDICSFLEIYASPEDLWGLYWCDSTFCGVANQQPMRLGQDPLVNKIINQCQNLGRPGIIDPGPPPEGYACSFYIDEPLGSDRQCGDAVMTVLADPVSNRAPIRPTATSDDTTSRLSSSTAEATTSFLMLTTSMLSPLSSGKPSWLPMDVQPALSSTSTASATASPPTSIIKPNATSDSSQGAGSSSAAAAHNDRYEKATTATTQGQLSIGGVAAIAVCVPVFLVILGFLACYLWRRKKSRKTDSFQGSLVEAHLRHNQHHAGQRKPAATTKYLVSDINVGSSRSTRARSTRPPADIVPLSPPPRLRDRKYLQSIFKRAESPPLTPLGPAEGDYLSKTNTPASRQHVFWDDGGFPGSPFAFPASPLFSPTVSKLEPRREHTVSLHPTSPVSNPFADHEPQLPPRVLGSPEHRRESGGSVGSGSGSTRVHAASSLRSQYVPMPGSNCSRRATPVARMPQADTPPPSPARSPRPHEERMELPNLLFGPLATSPQVSNPGFPSATYSTAAAQNPLGIRECAPSISSKRILPPMPRCPSGPGYGIADGSPTNPQSDTFPTRHRASSSRGPTKTPEQLRGEARALWEHTETYAREARDAPKVDARTIAAEAAVLRGVRPVFDLSERNSWSSLDDPGRMMFSGGEPRPVSEARKR